jgi:amino acid permease
MALGVLGLIAYIVIIVVAASGGVNTAVTRQNAINQIQADNTTLSRTLTPLASQTAACQSSSDPLHCITALDRKVGRAFHTFASGVRSTAMPTDSATTAAGQLATAADQAGNVFQKLGASQTAEQYQSTVASSNVEQVVGQVGTDYQELGSALNAAQ